MVLLREIHHRVRNNLQVISSLLELARMRTSSEEANNLLMDSHARIHSMALIHSQLYENDRFHEIQMRRHVRQLIANLSRLYGNDKYIATDITGAQIQLSLTQAVPCALVLNELISNVYKHAYKEGEKGTLEVHMEQSANGKICIRVKDHGIGIPEEIDIDQTQSLGLKLTRNLVIHQLKGQMQVNRNNGTEVVVEFRPLKEKV
ncbi:MAG: sensor histidine kinase [Pseudomonadota bacterium]